MVMEEAAYIRPKLYYSVILPISGKKAVVTLAISTPDDENNFYSKLVQLKDDDGNPMFLVYKVGLACEECIRNRCPEDCNHVVYRLPFWKSKRRHKRTKKIMSTQSAMFAREALGVIYSGQAEGFDRDWLQAFEERKHWVYNRPPEIVYTVMDPSGGGDSRTAIVSCTKVERGSSNDRDNYDVQVSFQRVRERIHMALAQQ